MTKPGRYMVPARAHRVEETIDRSRFITTIGPARSVEAARAFISDVSAEFPDATHNCWAYVVGPPGDTSRVGLSDAGEPHGTAGKPMLAVLTGCGVGDIAAVVTRYFGGVKLGKGGLVRAYSGGVKLALGSLPVVELVPKATLAIETDYASAESVKRALPDHEAESLDEAYGTSVVLTVRLPVERREVFVRAVAGLTNGRARVTGIATDAT